MGLFLKSELIAFAILRDLVRNSLYVIEPSLSVIATLSPFSITCFSKKSTQLLNISNFKIKFFFPQNSFCIANPIPVLP